MFKSSAGRVVVGISGGVDSSVAALLLKKRFKEVIGVFMRNWDPGDETGDSYTCPIPKDLYYAEKVCHQLDIPFYKVDFVKDYWANVFEPFLEGFGQGGTPNPDVYCNREIKFNRFKEFVAKEFGGETHFATGHYARLRHQVGQPPQLIRAIDCTKDQTYFLSAVPGDAFRNVHFPVGEFHKSEIREMATQANLCTASKKDSVGICFVGKRKFSSFLSQYIEPIHGNFLRSTDGACLGQHQGLQLYTIGQRANIPGQAQKLYVVSKNTETGDIVLAPRANLLTSTKVVIKKMYWVAGRPPIELEHGQSYICECTVRYRQTPVKSTVYLATGGDVHVEFHEPVLSVTEQQIAALYTTNAKFSEQVCLGGGEISEKDNENAEYSEHIAG